MLDERISMVLHGLAVCILFAFLTMIIHQDIKRNQLQEDLNNEVKRILVLSPQDSLIKLGPLTGSNPNGNNQ